MSRRVGVRAVVALAGMVIVCQCAVLGRAEEKKPLNVAGVWVGALEVMGAKIRLVFDIKKKDGGGYSATMDSPDQNAFGLPADEVSLEGRTLKLSLKALQGAFEGQLSTKVKEIAGSWSQGPLKLPLTLKPGEKAAPPKRPQEPTAPLPYDEEEVAYTNSAAKVTLAGTLTRPRGAGPFPAVLLLTGSGAQNRDEELAGHKPFLVLADYLTRRGLAVLRVDDRGVGKSTGSMAKCTIEDFVGDALAGVEYLRGREEIRGDRIGLIGHSEGGIVAPAAANQSSHVAFVVLLAGPGVNGEEIVCRQIELIGQASGVHPALLAKSVESQRRILKIVKEQPDNAKAMAELSEFWDALQAELTEEERKTNEASRGAVMQQWQQALSPWFRHFIAYDPKPALEKLRCPALAVIGEKDLQVDPKQNLSVIRAALETSGQDLSAAHELPGLNHLFQSCGTGAPPEYALINETFAPNALKLIGDWLEERVK